MSLQSLIESVNVLMENGDALPLHEVLKKSEYEKLFEEMAFGLEIECQVRNPKAFERGLKAMGYSREQIIRLRSTTAPWRGGGEQGPGFFRMIHEAYNISKQKGDEMAKEFEKASKNAGSARAIKKLMPLLDAYGEVFIGGYSGGSYRNGWRVERDCSLSFLGAEVITPLNRGKALSYEQIMKEVPAVCDLLYTIGFKGNEKQTGSHINISYKNKLTAYAFDTVRTQLEQKYSNFAVANYLSSQESDGLLRQGNYERWQGTALGGFTEYGQDYRSYLEQMVKSEDGYGPRFFREFLPGFIKKSLGRDSFNQNYVVKIPVLPFVTATTRKQLPKGFQWLWDMSRKFLNQVEGGGKETSLSPKDDRIELRGLGGEKAFLNYKEPAGLDKIIRLAVANLAPFLDLAPVKTKDVMRSTEIILREHIVPPLNEFILGKSTGVSTYDMRGATYGAATSSDINSLTFAKENGAKKMKTTWGTSITLLDGGDAEFAYIDNNLLGFEVDKGAREISVVPVKGDVEIISRRRELEGTSGMYDTQAQRLQYKTDMVKLAKPNLPKDITVSAGQPITISTTSAARSPVPIDPVPGAVQPITNDDTVIIMSNRAYKVAEMSTIMKRGLTLAFNYGDARYRYSFPDEASRDDALRKILAITQLTRRGQGNIPQNQRYGDISTGGMPIN
jgi:hypothetical protein